MAATETSGDRRVRWQAPPFFGEMAFNYYDNFFHFSKIRFTMHVGGVGGDLTAKLANLSERYVGLCDTTEVLEIVMKEAKGWNAGEKVEFLLKGPQEALSELETDHPDLIIACNAFNSGQDQTDNIRVLESGLRAGGTIAVFSAFIVDLPGVDGAAFEALENFFAVANSRSGVSNPSAPPKTLLDDEEKHEECLDVILSATALENGLRSDRAFMKWHLIDAAAAEKALKSTLSHFWAAVGPSAQSVTARVQCSSRLSRKIIF